MVCVCVELARLSALTDTAKKKTDTKIRYFKVTSLKITGLLSAPQTFEFKKP